MVRIRNLFLASHYYYVYHIKQKFIIQTIDIWCDIFKQESIYQFYMFAYRGLLTYVHNLWPILLTWIDFNPGMEK